MKVSLLSLLSAPSFLKYIQTRFFIFDTERDFFLNYMYKKITIIGA